MTVLVQVYPALWTRETIRLAGVDTPEIRGDCDREKEQAKAARDYVREQLAGAAEIRVSVTERLTFSRRVGRIQVDGEDLGGMLVGEGLARRGTKQLEWCGEPE